MKRTARTQQRTQKTVANTPADTAQLRDAAAVTRLIEATVTRFLRKDITPEAARLLLYASQVAGAAVKTLTLEAEIEKLKEAVARLQEGQQ